MRIAIDIREFAVSNTGISQFTGNLLKYLLSQKNEFEYFLFSNRQISDTADKLPKNYKLILSQTKQNLLYEQFVLPKLLKSQNIDIYFSPYYKIPLFLDIPTIATVHDIGFITFPLQYYARSGIYRFFAKQYLLLSLKKSAKLIAVSNYTKQEIIKHYKISAEKIAVIYNTVNPIFSEDIKNKYNLEINTLKNKFGDFILSVSNYKPHKNIKNLIEAFAKIKSKINHNLVLAGPLNSRCLELQKLANSKKIDDRIFFVFPKDNLELAQFYSAATVLAHPSLHEGFGLPIIEAQSCGCVVIAANTTSIPEIVNDSALLFDGYSVDSIAAALLKILEDEKLRNHYSIKSKENILRFTSEKIYPLFLEILYQMNRCK